MFAGLRALIRSRFATRAEDGAAKQPQTSILDAYATERPSIFAAFDIFEGEWSSNIPGLGIGGSGLFDDPRIKWLSQQCGGFSGKSILELGPLEGGHSFMMAKGKAARILAIESNTRAFLKCLIVKNALNFETEFQLGDFRPYLQATTETFDFVLACGVLYHMQEPETLLAHLSRVAPRLGLWTHYYDRDVIMGRADLMGKFVEQPEIVRFGGREVEKYQQHYLAALNAAGFCGGNAPTSYWLSRASLLGLLDDFGYKVTIGTDEHDHQNGPCILLYAER